MSVRCDVWFEALRDPTARELATLSDAERARARAYRRDADRKRSLLGAVLLRAAAAQLLDRDPGSVRVERRCASGHRHHGRPRFPEDDLAGSISHSAGWVAVACTSGNAVGIDIQRVPAALDAGVIAATRAAPEPRPTDVDAFARMWVRKESVVKATGEGLACPLREVLLGGGEREPRVLSYRRAPLLATIRDLDTAAGYRAAVTVLAPDVEAHRHGREGPR